MYVYVCILCNVCMYVCMYVCVCVRACVRMYVHLRHARAHPHLQTDFHDIPPPALSQQPSSLKVRPTRQC